MSEVSRGQALALLQLTEVAAKSNGALEILEHAPHPKMPGYMWVRMSLETKGYRTKNGLAFRDREQLRLLVPPEFPFEEPDLYFAHKRFIGTPHVQWGWRVCLYQSVETEYDPADGVFGFLERVEQWMLAAGEGKLDPDDAPLHPPAVYASSSTSFVMRADAPAVAGHAGDAIWLGRGDLQKVRSNRYDLVGWTHIDDWVDTPAHPVAAAILFDKPLASEFPTKVSDLIDLVERAGLSFALLYSLLKLFAFVGSEDAPAHFVIGAPMRRKAAGEPLRLHLTVWEIDPATLTSLRAIALSKGEDVDARKALAIWMVEASVRWTRVLEDRPEIVIRRDIGTSLETISGQRVLLLGCGALGSAVAEMLLRGGAAELHLVDCGIVKPGILVRQRYADLDVGLPKASALRERLTGLGLPGEVSSDNFDLTERALSRFDCTAWDLVVDATASARVTYRIEDELRTSNLAVPLLSISVSAGAKNGAVVVKMPGFSGGTHHIARRAKLKAFSRDAGHPLLKSFWPERGKEGMLQPEPGCSAPTFVGSAADIDHHAAGLLNIGVHRINTLATDSASMDLVGAAWTNDGLRQGGLSYQLENCARYPERRHNYTVLRSKVSAVDMAAELRRMARTRSDKIETGGLIFGEVDDAQQLIWVDSLSGPPPDSRASEAQFLCGTDGTTKLNDFKSESSGRSSRFIGIWHTHPVSRGEPSQDDYLAMVQLLHFQEHPPRHVLMLIVGFAASAPEENYYLFRRNEFLLVSRSVVQEGELS